jgi:transcriptional regulator GlxA family with amidase domain
MGSLCTGAHILARAGLLDGYRCTIHWENLASFVESFPALTATDELFTVDRNRFTCAGGTSAADMMLQRIAARHGTALAKEVAEQILQERIRPGSAPQPNAQAAEEPPAPALLERAREIMRRHVEEPIGLDAIAMRLRLSRRSLERLFLRAAGTSPARAYLEIRLRRARQLLKQTQMPVVEVALACGFTSPAHFSRCYRAAFGTAPRGEQRRASLGLGRGRSESEAAEPMPTPARAGVVGDPDGNVGGRQGALAADQVGGLLGDHDRGRVQVAGGDAGHDRGVDDP